MIKRILLAAFLAMTGLTPVIIPHAALAAAIPAEPDAERRTRYTPTASTGPFAIGFDLYADGTDYANWIEVYVNGVLITQSGNWTLTSPSGSLSVLARPITDAVINFTSAQTGTLDIVGARRPRRISQFNENSPITAHAQNQVLTDLWMTHRERWDRFTRLLLAPPGETLGALPSAAARANKFLGFDASGNPVPIVPTGGAATGDVFGPSSATADSNIVVFNGTGGKTIKDSGVKIGAAANNVPQLDSGGLFPVTNLSKGVWHNTRLAKTAGYAVAATDCGYTIAAGGADYYTLTLNAASGYPASCTVVIVNEDTVRAKLIVPNGGTNFRLYPGQSTTIYNQNNVWQVIRPGRWKLTQDTNIFVNPTGSDNSDCLVTGSATVAPLKACLSGQGAYDRISQEWDLSGYTATISLDNGSGGGYSPASGTTFISMLGPLTGAGRRGTQGAGLHIAGSGSANVSLVGTNANIFACDQGCSAYISGITVQTLSGSGNQGNAFIADNVGQYTLSDIVFNTAANHQVAANLNSQVNCSGPLTFAGGAVNAFQVDGNSIIACSGITITIGTNPTWTAWVDAKHNSSIIMQGNTYVFGTTGAGAYWNCGSNSVVDFAGATVPGNAAGSTATGCQKL